MMQKALAGIPVPFEWDYKRLDGSVFHCLVTLQKIVYEGEDCMRSAIVKRTLAQSDTPFIIDNSPIPVLTIAPDLSITAANQAWADVTGYSPEETKTLKLSDIRVVNRIGPTLPQVIDQKVKGTGEIEIEYKTGRTYLKYHYHPMYDNEGNLKHTICYYLDKTAEKCAITEILSLTSALSNGKRLEKSTTEFQGDYACIQENINHLIEIYINLHQKTGLLSTAITRGDLSVRIDPQGFKGSWEALAFGLNATLDAVIGPLNVAAEYVDRISKGDIPPKITDSYNGDFNEIKNNLNTCIDAVNFLVSDAKMLSEAAVNGALNTRAEATKHQGDFKAIVDGVNATLDAVIGPLNIAAEYVDRIAKGDIPPKITDS